MSGLYLYTLSFLKALDATKFFFFSWSPFFLLHAIDFTHGVIEVVYDCF